MLLQGSFASAFLGVECPPHRACFQWVRWLRRNRSCHTSSKSLLDLRLSGPLDITCRHFHCVLRSFNFVHSLPFYALCGLRPSAGEPPPARTPRFPCEFPTAQNPSFRATFCPLRISKSRLKMSLCSLPKYLTTHHFARLSGSVKLVQLFSSRGSNNSVERRSPETGTYGRSGSHLFLFELSPVVHGDLAWKSHSCRKWRVNEELGVSVSGLKPT